MVALLLLATWFQEIAAAVTSPIGSPTHANESEVGDVLPVRRPL